MKIATSARKLKVTAVIEATPFARLHIPDTAPARTELLIKIAARLVSVDLATKSVRKAVKTLTESDADNVILLLQGVLTSGDAVAETWVVAHGLSAASGA